MIQILDHDINADGEYGSEDAEHRGQKPVLHEEMQQVPGMTCNEAPLDMPIMLALRMTTTLTLLLRHNR